MAQKQKLQAAAIPEVQQSATQTTLPASTPAAARAIQPDIQPHYPEWPTSKPGPCVKLPPPGMRPVNAFRSEQVAEIGYNQAAGEPGNDRSLYSQSADKLSQPATAQDALGKYKQRL